MNALRLYLARRRRQVVRMVTTEVPTDRLKIVYLPLNPTEEQIASARREALASSRSAA